MMQTPLGILCAFLSSVTWAIGVSSYSLLSRTHAASTINFSRALVALPIFILAFLITSASSIHQELSSVHTANILWLSFSIICSYAVADVLLLTSVSIIGLPSALAIASGYPIWTALYGIFFRGETLNRSIWCGLLLAVSGTMLVILSGRNTESSGKRKLTPRFYLGVGLSILTSILWSLNTVSVANGGAGMSPFLANAIRMTTALLLCPIFGRLISGTKVVLLEKKAYKKALWVFALEGFGGSYFFLYGLTHAPISIASALSSLAPVITVPIAWIGGFEKPSFLRATGVVMVVAGVWFLVGFASL